MRDVARSELATDKRATALGSPDRFGYEWNLYSEMRPEYEEQFRRWTVHLTPEDWRGLRFTDVGCGMGRNSYWAMKYGVTGGVAIDVDEPSLAAARRTLASHPGVEVRELSAYDIEPSGSFNVVFSIGVIHHLEYPERALRAMAGAAKPGGRILIWVYGLENNRWIAHLLTPVRKFLFSRLPVALVHRLSLYPTALLWLGLRIGIGRIEYFRLARRLTFEHLRSIVLTRCCRRSRITGRAPRSSG